MTEWTKEKVEKYQLFFANGYAMGKVEAEFVLNYIDSGWYEDLRQDIGRWDDAGRFELLAKFETFTSVGIRPPSRAWPKSKWQHIATKKYIASLKEKAEFAIQRETISCLLQRAELMELVQAEPTEKRRAVL